MSVFESLNDTSNKAVDVGEQYYRKTQEYYKLKVFQQLTMTIGMLCKAAAIGSLLLLGVIVLAVAGILALGAVLGNMVYACLIIAAVLFLLGGIVYKFRSKIDGLIIRKMSKQFFD